MKTKALTSRRATRSDSLPWSVVVCVVISLGFLYPFPHPLPAAAVSVFIFSMVQVVFPSCRPSKVAPLCPWNWALLVFGINLVILPIAEVVGGVEMGLLPHLPSDLSINIALLIDTLAFVSFAIAYHLRRSRDTGQLYSRQRRAIHWVAPSWVIGIYLLIGIAGLRLFFGSFSGISTYFLQPSSYLVLQNEAVQRSASLAEALGGVLRHFLGFSFVMMFCRLTDSTIKRPAYRLWFYTTALVTLCGLSFAIFNYNRGAFAVPIVAIGAVVLSKKRAHAWRTTLSVGAVFVLLFSMSTIYRTTHGETDVSSDSGDWRSAISDLTIFSLIQTYGNGPQFLGFLLEETHWGEHLSFGRKLLSAAASPVPIVGKSFRDDTGTALYNNLMNRGDSQDQIIPFAGEVFLDFHVGGICLAFCLLGLAVARLQDVFERSVSSLSIYVIQFTSIWLLFLTVGSLSIVSQIFVYSFWPVYVFVGIRLLARIVLVPSAVTPAPSGA